MFIIKAGFEHGRCFCYFPTPLEPSPCDSPPLHPGKLSAWTAANKNSPVRGKWGPASAPRLWWGDTSLCISSSPPNHIICIICKWGEQDHSVGRGQLRWTWQKENKGDQKGRWKGRKCRGEERRGERRGGECWVLRQQEAPVSPRWSHCWWEGLKHYLPTEQWY